MASLIARLWTRLCAKRAPLTIMIVGLDNSGKTSILNNLVNLSHSGSNATNSSYQPQHNPQTTPASSSSPSVVIGGSAATMAESGFPEFEGLLLTSTSTLSSSSSSSSQPPLPTNSDIKGSHHQPNAANNNNNNNNSSQVGNIMPTVGYNYERIQYKSLTITVLDFSGQNRYRNLWLEFYNGVDGIVFVVDSSDLIRFVVVRDELETMLSHPYFSTLTTNSSVTTGPQTTNGQMDQTGSQQHMLSTSAQPVNFNVSALATQKQITISQGKLIQTSLDNSSSLASGGGGGGCTISVGKKSTTASANSVSGSHSKRRTKIPILFLANKTDLPNSVDTEVIKNALNLNQLPVDRHPWFIQATSVNLSQGIVEGFDWLVSQLSATN